MYGRLTIIEVRTDRVDSLPEPQEQTIPRENEMPGLRALYCLIDRASGRGVVGTLWDDEASMKAADAAAEQRRQEAASRGVEFSEMSTRVLRFSHLT